MSQRISDQTNQDIEAANAHLETLPAEQIVRWAVERFRPDLAVSSSFGADSAVMLHLATRVWPGIRVLFVNTGFLFPETLAFKADLERRLDLNVHEFRPRLSPEDFLTEHGRMFGTHPDACCAFLKREPFARAKQGLRAWMTGIRRDQSFTRRLTPVVAMDADGRVKICPLVRWTARDIHAYLKQHDLPYHPLREQGFLSIGCTHCTRAVCPGEDPRAGRWAGLDKTECGLHTYDKGSGI